MRALSRFAFGFWLYSRSVMGNGRGSRSGGDSPPVLREEPLSAFCVTAAAITRYHLNCTSSIQETLRLRGMSSSSVVIPRSWGVITKMSKNEAGVGRHAYVQYVQ